LTTAINIVIVVILYRVSHTSFNWHKNAHKIDSRHSSRHSIKKRSLSGRYHSQSSQNSLVATDTSHAIKQRTSAQVTRMLFAVTLSLIILNIPNTIIFLHTRIRNP
ncbi:unnamed protein product, partial [Rotaria sordida]